MNKKLIVMSSVIVCLLAVWLVLVYLPIHREMGDLDEKLESLEEMEKLQISINQLQYLRTMLDTLYMWVDESMERIYPENQLLDLGRVIENIGKEYGLKLVSIVPDYESLSLFTDQNGEIIELPIMMQFGGRFEKLTQFLDYSDALPYVLRINEVIIENNSASHYSSELDITLRGVIVLKKERTDEGEEEINQIIKPGLI